MLKRYQTKIYEIDGTYKKTLDPDLILNDISFSSNINGGQGELRLSLAVGYDYDGISYGDIVRVWESDENNDHLLIYTGSITKINRTYDGNNEGVTIIAVGLFAFLNRLFFKSGSNYSFSKNQDPAQTIKDVVDHFNSEYTANRLSYTDVDNYGSNVNIAFDYDKCNQAIQEIQKATESFYFFVDADGDITYKEKDGVVTHYFTLEKDVLSLNSEEDIESLANNVFVEYSGGVSNDSDATSQSTYGLIEEKISSNLNDSGSADIYAQDYIDQNKDFKKQTVLVVNSAYNIETIKPGDYVKLRNSKYELDGVQILKTQYSFDKVVCYLDKYTSLPQEISFIN